MTTAAAKALVRELWPESRGPVFGSLRPSAFAPDVAFHGPAPIGNVTGRDDLLNRVYAPLDQAFPAAERRPYLFLGGDVAGVEDRFVTQLGRHGFPAFLIAVDGIVATSGPWVPEPPIDTSDAR